MENIKTRKILKKVQLNPPAVLAFGFGVLIILGTILLSLPIATKNGQSAGIVNAMFTSASSVCVTGLIVVNTAEFWSLFGKIVIISLIQIGGLGFMTMATIIAIVLGKKINLKERLVIKEQLNQKTLSGLLRLTKHIIFMTLGIEFIGAVLLSTRFIPIYGWSKGIGFSIFHSISAFCNAGFDILGDSMIPLVGDITINFTISLLIILGGLGFAVYVDCIKNRRSLKKLSLHSKLVILITIILLLVGTVLFFAIEYNNPMTIGELKGPTKIMASFFQSVVARTAGFSSVDIGSIRDTTAFLLIILMYIGASPGSTGGGIKTTTLGVLVLTVISTIKGESDVSIFKKRIPEEIIKKSLSIVFISISLIILVSFILTITEEPVFLDLLFETTSAFSTAGLSRGITYSLSSIGKIILTLTMYIGRVGPLTMAFALSNSQGKKNYRYSEGDIIVG